MRHVFGGVLRGNKHQHPAPARFLHQVRQQRCALGRVHGNGALLHHGVGDGGGFNGDVFGLVQQAGGQRLHRVGEGGREQQILAARRQQRQHAAQLVGKTQVEQAVGFVQHQHRHM